MARLTKPESCIKCPYKWEYLDLLGEENINTIQRNCIIIMFKKGETICKQGTEVTHALYLAKGVVKLYIEGKKNLILKLIKSGNYIDLQTLFGDRKYKYSVAAIEDTMICMTPIDLMLDLAKENSPFLFQLTTSISNSTNYVFQKINNLSSKQLRGRLAETILYLSEEIYKSYNFHLDLTRNELAEFSSMSMENAVRILTEFRKDKLITLNGRDLEITQPEMLRKISDLG